MTKSGTRILDCFLAFHTILLVLLYKFFHSILYWFLFLLLFPSQQYSEFFFLLIYVYSYLSNARRYYALVKRKTSKKHYFKIMWGDTTCFMIIDYLNHTRQISFSGWTILVSWNKNWYLIFLKLYTFLFNVKVNVTFKRTWQFMKCLSHHKNW